MESHIDVITLAVSDLERSMEFYRDGLGPQSEGWWAPSTRATSSRRRARRDVKPAGGPMLMLYPRGELARRGRLAATAARTRAGAQRSTR